MDAQSLYSVVAHNRFIEDLTEKAREVSERCKAGGPDIVGFAEDPTISGLCFVNVGFGKWSLHIGAAGL